MDGEKKSHAFISVLRDLAVVLGVIVSIIGFGPNIIESLDKLQEAWSRYNLYSSYVDYGKRLFEEELYSEAVDSFKEALALRPNDFDAQVWFKKAQLMLSLNKLSNIKKEELPRLSFEVEFVIRSNPEEEDIYRYYYVQGNIRYFLKDFKGAKKSYEKAIELKPDFGKAWANLGAALNELKRHEAATKALRKALKAENKTAEVYNDLVLALYSSGKSLEAVSVAREGLEKFPANAAIYNELGIALYKLGRKEEAASALKTALVMTSKKDLEGVIQRTVNLAYPLADIGRIDEALSYLENARKLTPDDPYVYLALAHCYLLAKNDSKAVDAYEKISSLGSHPNPHDLVKWAEALYRLKRPREAARILYIALGDAANGQEIRGLMEKIKALSVKLNDQELFKRIDEVEKSKNDKSGKGPAESFFNLTGNQKFSFFFKNNNNCSEHIFC